MEVTERNGFFLYFFMSERLNTYKRGSADGDDRRLDHPHRLPTARAKTDQEARRLEPDVEACEPPRPIKAPVEPPGRPRRDHHDRPGEEERDEGDEHCVPGPAQAERQDNVRRVKD